MEFRYSLHGKTFYRKFYKFFMHQLSKYCIYINQSMHVKIFEEVPSFDVAEFVEQEVKPVF